MITQNELKEILDYNQEAGIFTWKAFKANNKVRVGDVAGCLNSRGYIQIKVNSKLYRAHRLAWLYFYGSWPKNYIDHINGNPSDNRIENLRDVTQRENTQNRKEHRNGHLLGTTYDKRAKKWVSQIRINGKLKNLGLFETKELAHETYTKELEKLNEN